MKRPFKDYLTLIENELGVQLFCWQKDALRHIYDGNLGHLCFGRQCGITLLTKAALMLYEEMERDAGNLSSRLYELDSYSTTVVTCDDDWGENIEWEKENEI